MSRRTARLRIVGGSFGGRTISVPVDEGSVRPTSERLREAIASALEARGAIAGRRVLDLFAGSGALAFEALSRGASRATLIERHPAVVRYLQGQIRELALGERARLWAGDAAAFLRSAPASGLAGPYDLVLIDPPYDDTAPVLAAVVPALVAGRWLAESAVVVCEYDRAGGRRPPAWPSGLVVESTRHYGQTAVDFLRFSTNSTDSTDMGAEC